MMNAFSKFAWLCVGVNLCTLTGALDKGDMGGVALSIGATALILFGEWARAKGRA